MIAVVEIIEELGSLAVKVCEERFRARHCKQGSSDDQQTENNEYYGGHSEVGRSVIGVLPSAALGRTGLGAGAAAAKAGRHK